MFFTLITLLYAQQFTKMMVRIQMASRLASNALEVQTIALRKSIDFSLFHPSSFHPCILPTPSAEIGASHCETYSRLAPKPGRLRSCFSTGMVMPSLVWR